MSNGAGPSEGNGQAAERRYSEGRHRESRLLSPFVPILVIALALLVWSAFQTIMLVRESNALATGRDNQEAQVQTANKLRQALDAVARDTAKLADKGNPNARLIVAELRKRGVSINPDAPPPGSK